MFIAISLGHINSLMQSIKGCLYLQIIIMARILSLKNCVLSWYRLAKLVSKLGLVKVIIAIITLVLSWKNIKV